MRSILIAAALLASAAPALAQTTLQITPQGIQAVDPRRDAQRDAARDAQRDAERDQLRDAQRDAQIRDQSAQRYASDQNRNDVNNRGDQNNRYEGRDDRGNYRTDANGQRHYDNGDRRDWQDERRDGDRTYGYNGRDGARDWRYDGNRYSYGAYDYPRGYGYRNWSTGTMLPSAYWTSSRYWISNPTAYRLSRPWDGVRWVRVNHDALLIRTRNGQIVSVVRGIFV